VNVNDRGAPAPAHSGAFPLDEEIERLEIRRARVIERVHHLQRELGQIRGELGRLRLRRQLLKVDG
jgi:hypothetical protein